jgi:hypothetical protein
MSPRDLVYVGHMLDSSSSSRLSRSSRPRLELTEKDMLLLGNPCGVTRLYRATVGNRGMDGRGRLPPVGAKRAV